MPEVPDMHSFRVLHFQKPIAGAGPAQVLSQGWPVIQPPVP